MPLLGLLGLGPYVRYTEFGLPSLHGLLNAILLVLSNYSFHTYLQTRQRKYLGYYLLTLAWPIALVTRQLLMSILIQSSLIYAFHRRSIWLNASGRRPRQMFLPLLPGRRFIGIGLCVALAFYVFGTLGDVRNVGARHLSDALQPLVEVQGVVGTSLLWVYWYWVSPLGNIVQNIETVAPTYIPLHLIETAVPSVVRGALNIVPQGETWELATELSNVSSFHQPFLLDFGIMGALMAYVVLAVLVYYLYTKAMRSPLICWRFAYIVAAHDIILSPFTNFFTHLVFMAQIFLHISLQVRWRW
jgi:oligosaccharide repeat unit polymerase